MTVLEQALEGTKSVAILGHVRPDGDCLGSTLGLYNYLLASYPDIQLPVYPDRKHEDKYTDPE